MNKRHYEHTLPNIRGSLSNTYDKKAVFRSTLFPASRPLVRGSNLEELITEIVYYIKLK